MVFPNHRGRNRTELPLHPAIFVSTVPRKVALPEAEEEFLAEVAYYEGAEPGLGARFRVAVEAATQLVAMLPNVGAQETSDYKMNLTSHANLIP